jgi:hypothetical protein
VSLYSPAPSTFFCGPRPSPPPTHTHAFALPLQAVAELTYQYRMNEPIQLLANTLVYDHALQCGNKDVATSLLVLQGPPVDQPAFPAWVTTCLVPEQRVVFLDTDCMGQDAWELSRTTAQGSASGPHGPGVGMGPGNPVPRSVTHLHPPPALTPPMWRHPRLSLCGVILCIPLFCVHLMQTLPARRAPGLRETCRCATPPRWPSWPPSSVQQ